MPHKYINSIATELSKKGHCYKSGNRKILIGVSGGADSIALLRAVDSLSYKRGWNIELTVGHIQHHLRPEAEQEAQFVSKLAQDLDLPFLRTDIDLSNIGSANLEEMASKARYTALLDMAKSCRATEVMVAHHADDQLETVLMRLIRGTSINGLSAMPWVRGLDNIIDLIRPALSTDHATAISYLNSIKQTWCEDISNTDITRLRARLRHRIVPELKAIRPDISNRIVELTDHINDAVVALDAVCTQNINSFVYYDYLNGESTIDRSETDHLSEFEMSSMIHREVNTLAGISVSSNLLKQITRAIFDESGEKREFNVKNKVRITVDSTSVILSINN